MTHTVIPYQILARNLLEISYVVDSEISSEIQEVSTEVILGNFSEKKTPGNLLKFLHNFSRKVSRYFRRNFLGILPEVLLVVVPSIFLVIP